MTDIHTALAPVRRRIRRNRLWRGMAMGFALGGVAALALIGVSLLTPVPDKWIQAGVILAAVVILCATAGFLRPVRDGEAARAADACGLQERAITALETAGDSPMEALQRQDACEALGHLDTKRIRPGSFLRLLVIGAAACILCAATILIPNPRDTEAAHMQALRKQLARSADELDQAARADASRLDEKEAAELRRLTEDLKRDLKESRDEADALVAADRAEKRLEEIRQTTAAEAMQALTDALAAAGMETAAEALKSGDEQALAAALSGMDAEALQALAEQLSGAAREAAESLASGTQSTAEAMQSLSEAGSETGQALQNLKSAMSGGNKSGSGSAGSGSTPGEKGQSGGGAGRGTTNEEQPGGGGKSQGSGGQGKPEYREGQYETIYDPEKAEVSTRDEMTNQHAGDGDSVQIRMGQGKGTLEGDVPYGDVVREYAQTQTRSAERENLTAEQREWVAEYFRILVDSE